MPIKHFVQQGECISSISFKYGFFPDTIWNLPENSDLKKLRKDPNILMEGDIVIIPDKRLKKESCQFGKKNSFKRKGVPEKLIFQFLDRNGKPRNNEDYELIINGKPVKNKTDKDGFINQFIPPDAKEAVLLLGENKEIFTFNLGNLDPLEEISGVQGVLKNLDLYEGPINGELDEQTVLALKEFQFQNGLDQTGKIDDATLEALKSNKENN